MKNVIVKCIHYKTGNTYVKDICMSPFSCIKFLFKNTHPILGVECKKGVIEVDWVIFITQRIHFENEFQFIEEK